MEGLKIIGTYFTEFNEILVGYVSQPSPTKHEFKASCRNGKSCFLLTKSNPFSLF